jgi:hypothetical protein
MAPYRRDFYTAYPTRELRKGHTFRDYLRMEKLNPTFDDYGLHAKYDPEGLQYLENIRSKGYKQVRVSENISPTLVFKRFFMQPMMQCIKRLFKTEYEQPIKWNYNALAARNLEAFLRINTFTIPILQIIFGDKILDKLRTMDEEEEKKYIQKIMAKPAYKEAIRMAIRELVKNSNEVLTNMVPIMYDYLTTVKTIVNDQEVPILSDPQITSDANFASNLIVEIIESPEWQENQYERRLAHPEQEPYVPRKRKQLFDREVVPSEPYIEPPE